MINKELEIKLMEEVDGKKLMEHAEYITSQDRESGSPGENRAAEYFRSVMGTWGWMWTSIMWRITSACLFLAA